MAKQRLRPICSYSWTLCSTLSTWSRARPHCERLGRGPLRAHHAHLRRRKDLPIAGHLAVEAQVCAAIGAIRTGFLEVNPSWWLLRSLPRSLGSLRGGAEVGECAFLSAKADGMPTVSL